MIFDCQLEKSYHKVSDLNVKIMTGPPYYLHIWMNKNVINIKDLIKQDYLHQNNVEIMKLSSLPTLPTLHIWLMTVTMRKYFGMLIPNKNVSPRLSTTPVFALIKKIRNILNEHHQENEWKNYPIFIQLNYSHENE